MRVIIALFAFLVFVPSPAAANPYGHWAVKGSGETLIVLELHEEQGGAIKGQLVGPSHFQLASGEPVFSNVTGPVKTRHLMQAMVKKDALELTFGTSEDATTYIWRVTGPNEAELSFRDFPSVKLPFSRASQGELVSRNLDPDRAYVVERDWPTNREMEAIYKADQAARMSPGKINWPVVTKEDKTRRARTKALLDAHELHSGLDFMRAAFVFQHGVKSDDYLLAHTLALIAMARGRPDAAWISAATLDRYLQSVGERQIYGTQSTGRANEPPSQEPYNRDFIPPDLRHALGVP